MPRVTAPVLGREVVGPFGVGLIPVSDERIDPELVLYADPRHLRNVKP